MSFSRGTSKRDGGNTSKGGKDGKAADEEAERREYVGGCVRKWWKREREREQEWDRNIGGSMLDSARVGTYTLLLCSLARPLPEPPPTPHGHLPASSCSDLGQLLKPAWPKSCHVTGKGRPNFSLLPILCRNLIKAATRSATSFRRSADPSPL